MKPKALVAVVVVLVVLFAAGLVWRPGTDLTPRWVESLGESLVGEQPLAIGDVGATTPDECRQLFQGDRQMTLPATGACTVTIRKSTSRIPRVRTVELRLIQGLEAQVRLVQREKDRLTVKEELTSDEPNADVDIFQGGGTLIVQCLGGVGGAGCEIQAR